MEDAGPRRVSSRGRTLEESVIKRSLAALLAIVAVVAGVVVVLVLRDSDEVVVDMEWTVGDSCPDAVVIGAAGSGQRDDVFGVGPQVVSAVSGFTTQLQEQTSSSISVGFMALDYPATGVIEGTLFGFLGEDMFESITRGREMLMSLIGTIGEQCRHTSVFLIGYSQGASVVHDAVDRMPEAFRGAIGGVAVISDPSRDADDPNTRHLTTEVDSTLIDIATPHTRDGVFGPIATPTSLNGSFYSVCARVDAVCNFAFVDILAADLVHTEETYHGLAAEVGRLLADGFLKTE